MEDPQYFVNRDGRELSRADVDLLREIDEKAEELRGLVDKVASWQPSRWFEISNARANLQQGMSWLRRVASQSKVF